MFRKPFLAALVGLAMTSSAAFAHGDETTIAMTSEGFEASATANGHAPIGVMGDHTHNKGEWMLAYRYNYMHASGLIDGDSSISADTLVTNYPNRFSGMAGQPPTIRVAPDSMTMQAHMFGAMYAPTDWMTLIAMIPYMDKSMTAITYQGMAGTNILGKFSMDNSGLGDIKIGTLFPLIHDKNNKLVLKTALSLPTGSITKSGDMLMPNGMTGHMRMGYGMQLGTGTYDFMPALTYQYYEGPWSFGAQYSAAIRLESENDEGYRHGNKHSLTGWASYQWKPWISTSMRLDASTQDSIHGIDPNIMGPNPAADPDNYGGESVDAKFGVNLIGPRGAIRDHRLAFEVTAPLYQNTNGPQLERDWALMIGWQKAF